MTAATVLDLKKLHGLIVEAKDILARGGGKITFRKIDLSKIMVVTSLDASFAKEEGLKSQSGFCSMICSSDVITGPTICNLVEYQSVRISRVVKSTMAAESAALSTALDRQLYLRLLVESMLHGEPETNEDWRHQLKIPGVLVTDARSLFDHINKTGSLPTERQTLIDLLVARDLVEANAVKVCWVPTTHQLADVFTKMMKPPPVMEKFLRTGFYSLVQTDLEGQGEEHRAALRQAQRQRRKERDKSKKDLKPTE